MKILGQRALSWQIIIGEKRESLNLSKEVYHRFEPAAQWHAHSMWNLFLYEYENTWEFMQSIY